MTSLILPVYNPGATIDATCSTLQSFVASSPRPWEVIFVCDGCTDDAPERLIRLTRGWGARVLVVPRNRGKGNAVRFGLSEATGAYRVFTDFDLAYRVSEVESLTDALRGGADFAIASRTHPESEIIAGEGLSTYSYSRRLQGRVFNRFVRSLLPIRQRDTQAGLKGMTGDVAQRILPHLQIDGFGFDCELLTACDWFRIPITEVPVRVHLDSVQSTVNWRATRTMVAELFQIRRLWKHGPPPARPLATVALGRAG